MQGSTRLAAWALSLLLCLASPLRAGTPPDTAATPALWRVADKDTTIWLFGTVHALPPGIAWYRGAVRTAFEGSGELVTEISDTAPASMEELVRDKAMLPAGQTLRDLMTDERRQRYDAAMAGLRLPAETFDGFEPWYAAIMIATLPMARDGFETQHGVEETLDAMARARGLPHGALETAEYQLSLFDALPPDVQQRYLDQVIGQLPTIREQLLAMIAAWKAGDAERLAAIINDDNDDPVLMQRLLIDRNVAWARWIARRLDRPGTVFVAVGAGHLAGKGSVQAQLARQGLVARRLQ